MSYIQAQQRKKHLLKTYRCTKNSCGGGVAYNADKGFYYKYTVAKHGRARQLRKVSNKKIRTMPIDTIGNFSTYRKHYDYKWHLY